MSDCKITTSTCSLHQLIFMQQNGLFVVLDHVEANDQCISRHGVQSQFREHGAWKCTASLLLQPNGDQFVLLSLGDTLTGQSGDSVEQEKQRIGITMVSNTAMSATNTLMSV